MGIMINPELIKEYELQCLSKIQREPRKMNYTECGRFLGISHEWLARQVATLPGFPVKVCGKQNVIEEDKLFDWLYGHPAGIKWRKRWQRLGRLKKLEWGFLK